MKMICVNCRKVFPRRRQTIFCKSCIAKMRAAKAASILKMQRKIMLNSLYGEFFGTRPAFTRGESYYAFLK